MKHNNVKLAALVLCASLCVNSNTAYAKIEKPDIASQISGMLDSIATGMSLSRRQIDILSKLSGNVAIYVDCSANIYKDETAYNSGYSFDILDNNIIANPNVTASVGGNIRGTQRYLPDLAYSVCYYVNELYKGRLNIDRGEDNIYFKALSDEIASNICFYESVLEYYGASDEQVSSVYDLYLYLINNKNTDEYVAQNIDGQVRFKEPFNSEIESVLGEFTGTFCKLVSYDGAIVGASGENSVRSKLILPYELYKPTRSNTLLAATSIVGKVRYIWGGGHPYSSNIEGFNEAWFKWNSLYKETGEGEGWSLSIRSDKYNCPVHGEGSDWTCAFSGGAVNSVSDYLEKRSEYFDTTDLNNQAYINSFRKIDWSDGYGAHSFDGLDCSGYLSWIFNQIDNSRKYGTSAMYFLGQSTFRNVEYGDEMQPGDVVAWTSHIIMIVGKYREGSKVYLTVECTPNVIKFGTCYLGGASWEDMNGATNLAIEANQLFGGLNSNENPHSYNLDTVGGMLVHSEDSENASEPESVGVNDAELGELGEAISESEVQEEESESGTEEVLVYRGIGRYRWKEEHELVELNGKEVAFEELTARDVVKYLANNMMRDYLTGYDDYTGDLVEKE